MRFGALDVLARAAGYVRSLLLAHVADAFGGKADDEAWGGNSRPSGTTAPAATMEPSPIFAPLRMVRPSLRAVVLDLAPVHDRVVAEDASLANDRGIAVGVEDAAVLHVGPGPIRMGSVSPRSTAPYQTLDSSPR